MPRQLDIMHKLYGKDHAHKCGNCCCFDAYKAWDKPRRKCERYGYSHSEATDWARSWTACGMFDVPVAEDDRPVKDWTRKLTIKNEDDQLEGQMRLEV